MARSRAKQVVCSCSSHGCGKLSMPDGSMGKLNSKQTQERHAEADRKNLESTAAAAWTTQQAAAQARQPSAPPNPLDDYDLAPTADQEDWGSFDASDFPHQDHHDDLAATARGVNPEQPPQSPRSPSRSPSPTLEDLEEEEGLRVGFQVLNERDEGGGDAAPAVTLDGDEEDEVDENFGGNDPEADARERRRLEEEEEPERNQRFDTPDAQMHDPAQSRGKGSTTPEPTPRVVTEVLMDDYFYNSTYEIPRAQLCPLILVVLLHLHFHLPRQACEIVLFSIPFIVLGFLTLAPDSIPSIEPALNLPKTLATTLRSLFISPVLIHYPLCTKCLFVHPPIEPSNSASYPTICNYQRSSRSPACQNEITKRHPNGRVEALQKVAHQPLEAFIAQQVVRPGVEEIWQSTRDKLRETHDPMLSFFDGELARKWRDEKGRSMADLVEEEDVYTLFVMGYADWFNFAGNKHGAKHSSSGTHAYVFLNLPPEMIWKDENVYLADVFPGPREPDVDEINHLLRLTVDDLLLHWNSNDGKGLFFTKTRLRPQGVFIRIVLVHVLGDLPAIRKLLACAGHSAIEVPCPHCNLRADQFHRCDVVNWKGKSDKEWREQAEEYRSAELIKDKVAAFNRNGLRSSEYLRLPYFSPTLAIGIDPVHNLFMGLVKTHVRHNLGSDIQSPSCSRQEREALPIRSSAGLPSSSSTTTQSTSSSAQYSQPRQTPSVSTATRTAPTKLKLVFGNAAPSPSRGSSSTTPNDQAGDTAMNQEPESDKEENRTSKARKSSKPKMILGKNEIPLMQLMISQMEVPQWIGRLPKEYGTAGAGSLKADQIRSLIQLILLPFLVVRWSSYMSDASSRSFGFAQTVFHLCAAITLLFRRTLEISSIDKISGHLRRFHLFEFQQHPSFEHKPNNHLSLHLEGHARLLGPVNYWCCWGGERLNGKLGKINNNGKEGQVEISAIHSFCCSANLNALLARTDIPGLPTFIAKAKQQIEALHRGTVNTDEAALAATSSSESAIEKALESTPAERKASANSKVKTSPITLSPDLYSLLLSLLNSEIDSPDQRYRHSNSLAAPGSRSIPLDNRASSLSRFSLNANSCSATHIGDSNVIVNVEEEGGEVVERAGRVEKIFSHKRANTDGETVEESFVVVRLWKNLTDNTVFDQWGEETGTKVYSSSMEEEIRLLRVANVVCHSAVHRADVLGQLSETFNDKQIWKSRVIVVSLYRG